VVVTGYIPATTYVEFSAQYLDTGDDNIDEQERRHAPKYAIGNRGYDGCDLSDDAKEEQEAAAAESNMHVNVYIVCVYIVCKRVC
jgi:hypothetical protein